MQRTLDNENLPRKTRLEDLRIGDYIILENEEFVIKELDPQVKSGRAYKISVNFHQTSPNNEKNFSYEDIIDFKSKERYEKEEYNIRNLLENKINKKYIEEHYQSHYLYHLKHK